jgi:hypothetical protein
MKLSIFIKNKANYIAAIMRELPYKFKATQETDNYTKLDIKVSYTTIQIVLPMLIETFHENLDTMSWIRLETPYYGKLKTTQRVQEFSLWGDNVRPIQIFKSMYKSAIHLGVYDGYNLYAINRDDLLRMKNIKFKRATNKLRFMLNS